MTRKPISGSDLLLFGLLGLLTLSLLVSGTPVQRHQRRPPMWRLVMSFSYPACLYWIARQAPLDRREWSRFLGIVAVLGGYLSFTAIAEITKQWSLVFPSYISDPDLGITSDRAGPGFEFGQPRCVSHSRAVLGMDRSASKLAAGGNSC